MVIGLGALASIGGSLAAAALVMIGAWVAFFGAVGAAFGMLVGRSPSFGFGRGVLTGPIWLVRARRLAPTVGCPKDLGATYGDVED